MTTKRKPKPIDHMDADELEAHALALLTDATKQAALSRHGRWRRSKYTDAICRAGRDWHPGMPLPGPL